jgi:hypothetical protein
MLEQPLLEQPMLEQPLLEQPLLEHEQPLQEQLEGDAIITEQIMLPATLSNEGVSTLAFGLHVSILSVQTTKVFLRGRHTTLQTVDPNIN